MYYNDMLEVLNKRIEECERESKNLQIELYPYRSLKLDSSYCQELENLRQQIISCEQSILYYKREKEHIIDKMLEAGSIGIGEFIAFLEKFGLYYKTINRDSQTIIAPIDYCLVTTRSMPDTKLAELRDKKIYQNIDAKEYEKGLTVMPAYKTVAQFDLYQRVEVAPEAEKQPENKKSKFKRFGFNSIAAIINNLFNKVEPQATVNSETSKLVLLNEHPLTREEVSKFVLTLTDRQNLEVKQLPDKTVANDYLKDMSAIMIVGQFGGVQLYIRDKDTVKLNPELINVCSCEMLGIIEGYVLAKYEGTDISLTKFYELCKCPKTMPLRSEHEEIRFLYEPQHQMIYKEKGSLINAAKVPSTSVYIKNYINFHNNTLAEYPSLSDVEIWCLYYDLALKEGTEKTAIDEEILSLFTVADLEFMDYYRGCKKANPSLDFGIIENSYVKNQAGRYRKPNTQ